MNNKDNDQKAGFFLLIKALIAPAVTLWVFSENISEFDTTYFFMAGIFMLVVPLLLIFRDITGGDKPLISLYSDLFSGNFNKLSIIHKISIMIFTLTNATAIIFIIIHLAK